MLGLKKFLFMGGASHSLPADLRTALDAWRALPAPDLGEVHFHTRYVVIDITCSGTNPEQDQLLSIAASCVRRGMITPEDSLFIDFSAPENDASPHETTTDPAVDRKLIAFLQFIAKAPIVTYNVAFVRNFLQHVCKTRLGIDFQPTWIDLAWMLPSLFKDKHSGIMPLDQWLQALGLPLGNTRRSLMDNTLLIARIFQMLLVRAKEQEINTAAKLIDESRASMALRRHN